MISRLDFSSIAPCFRKYTDPLQEKVEQVSLPVIKWALGHPEVTIPACTVLPTLPFTFWSIRSLAHAFPDETPLVLMGSIGSLLGGCWTCYNLFMRKTAPFLVKTCLTHVVIRMRNYRWLTTSLEKVDLSTLYYDFNSKDEKGENILHQLARHPSLSDDILFCVRALCIKELVDCNGVNNKGESPLDLASRVSTEEVSVFGCLLRFGACLRKSTSLLQQLPIVELIRCLKCVTIVVDKKSPFSPIFEELQRVQKQIPGGESDSDWHLKREDKGSYREDLQNGALIHRHPDMTPFRHTLTTLLALQELHAPEYQALIREHNNSRPLGQNLAADLIFNLTGIVIHLERNSPAIIENFCNMVLTTFNKAQNEGHTLDFFRKGFQPGNVCLEGRMVHFQEWAFPPDFVENILPEHSLPTKLGEYFRVFRNKRFREMVGDEYESLVDQMRRGLLPEALAKRFKNFCRKGNFLKYLKRQGADPAIIAAAQDKLDFLP